ncbi:MAG: type III-B CRISPR module RAMP protein Cmr4 [Chloroflexia bacterium]
MNARLLFVHALSPLHAGTGQGIGVIDLPIAREKATGLPFLPGSSIKGSLRDSCTGADCVKVFGPDTKDAEDHASSAQFADARLLLLPVRSLAGTFAWVTSPYVLRRFARDAADAGMKNVPDKIPEPPALDKDRVACLVVEGDCKICPAGAGKQVYLEDLDLDARSDAATKAWADWLADHLFPKDEGWHDMLPERFCVVPDDILSFLLDTATEITARIKLLPDTKTVQDGGLWYEEALPAESILAGLVVATPVGKTGLTVDQIFKVVEGLTGKTVQFGGKATVGRGLCRTQLAE